MSSNANVSSPSSGQLQTSDDQVIFSNFFNCWLAQQDRNLARLYSALDNNKPQGNESNSTREVVNQVMGDYEYYYHAKTASARYNVLPMFSPTWTSRTDNLFIWIGGWRPTTAFHILYSKCRIQLYERHMVHMSPDLGGLTQEKMEKVKSMQRETVRVEKQISEEVAAYQETVASAEMVEISHHVTEVKNSGEEDSEGMVEAAMAHDMEEKRNKMTGILERADALRLNTLKRVVEVLNPMQAVHFLIAVTELLLRVHEFGQSMDFAADVAGNNQTQGYL